MESITPPVLILLGWNLIVFLLYGIDKAKARQKRWRISERTLIGCAFLGGGLGALAGMYSFRHKTRKWKFRILVPAACLLTLTLLYLYMKGGVS